MVAPVVDILMYHSVSNAEGPTSIAPEIFAEQMAAIAEAGVKVISLDDLLSAKAGKTTLPKQSIIITFDDGFKNFAETAWPVMEKFGFSPIVYVPTGWVAKAENWRGANEPARRLMNWAEIREMSDAGVSIGSHAVSHPDLTTLPDDALLAELCQSRKTLEDRLGKAIPHFAPPYGLTTQKVRDKIAKEYKTSVGTRLDRSDLQDDVFDLPRLEMFYFNDLRRWRNHLAQRGTLYLNRRRLLRRVRETVSKPWERV